MKSTMAGFKQNFAHFLRTGHFISDNTSVTPQQLNLIRVYKGANPTLFDAMPPHQSIKIVATPTNSKISEQDCPHCKKSIDVQFKEAEKKLEETIKACEEKLDKLQQSVLERLSLFEVHAPSLATASEGQTTENKEGGKNLRSI